MAHDFSTTQVDLPPHIATRIHDFAARIPSEHLAEDGVETHPHVTLKYGLHTANPADVAPLLTNEAPLTARFGKTSIFPASETGSDYDVVKVDVASPDLQRLNGKIAAALPHTDTHPLYKPHATIAYVKAGMGQQYAGSTFLAGQQATFPHVTFSSKDGQRTVIPLGARTMSTLDTKQRDALPAADFGDPAGRSFPIVDQDDVDSAAHLIGKAGNPEAVKARIIAIATRKGLTLPDAWQAGSKAHDEPGSSDVHQDGVMGKVRVTMPPDMARARRKGGTLPFLSRFVARLKERMGTQGYATREDFNEAFRHARGHAGGAGCAAARADPHTGPSQAASDLGLASYDNPDMPGGWMPCPACSLGQEGDCTCGPCTAGDWEACWCDGLLHPEAEGVPAEPDGDDNGPAQTQSEPGHIIGSEHVHSASGEAFRLYLAGTFAEAPARIPYLPTPGVFQHPRYGEISLTRERNADFVSKFNSGVYQKQIPLDAEHQTKLSGAMAWIQRMEQNPDGSVDAHVEWTDRGRTLMAGDRFKYISPEWYDSWDRPDTGEPVTNVAIGGALTTRPYFKESALRPLVAGEQGIYVPGEDSAPVPPSVRSNRAAAAYKETTPMADNPTTVAPEAKGMTEEQARAFAEMQTRLSAVEAERDAAKQASEAASTQAKQAAEQVAALRTEAQTRAFTEEVRGERWFGETSKHVSMLTTLTDTFGAASAEVSTYRDQNRAFAEMMKQSDLFRSVGVSGVQGDLQSDSPTDRLTAKVNALMASEKIAYTEALDRVTRKEPQLYREYQLEQRTARH